MSKRYFLLAILLCWLTAASPPARSSEKDEKLFVAKIAPLLQTHCLKCHSHQARRMESGLALDSRSGWAEGGDSGPAIVAGQPDRSLLIKAVRHTDPHLKMPPESKLSDDEIALLERWVRMGAPDPRVAELEGANNDWWSLQPLVRPATAPSSSDHPIDAFIQAKLDQQGISAAPQADRRTLIRRLYFDLHGLMPTPEEVKAFVADPDPQAYETLVDRLLDSPRYGERWGRHWLDIIHFADSHGCEHDYKRPAAWRFRDYVINRLNEDVAWGRFIREQLAADEFYPEQPELTAALGFIGAGPLELSRAGTAPVTFDYLDRDDMVTQTMAAFTSTTVHCARCHAHKFDPITQEDYYALQAVFAGVGKGDVQYDVNNEIASERKRLQSLIDASSRQDPTVLLDRSIESIVAAWEQVYNENPARWRLLEAETFVSTDGAALSRQLDGSYLASGDRPERDTYVVSKTCSVDRLTALRLEILTDESLPQRGPGRADNGNLHLTEFEAQLFVPGSEKPNVLKFESATASWNQENFPIEHALDGNRVSSWGIYPKVGQPHHAVFELPEPVVIEPGTRLVVSLRQQHGAHHLIGRFRLLTTDADPDAARLLSDSLVSALETPAADRSRDQRLEIAAYAVARHAEKKLQSLPAKVAVFAASPYSSRGKKFDDPQPIKVVQLLRRGDINQPIREVGPGALSAISAIQGRFDNCETESDRRAALADWLASPDNPLTWRSVVNRVWDIHFGRGICDTPNDFGRMGGTPSHGKLLDWLAVWFREDAGGSLKQLHRLILTSDAWKRSASTDRHASQLDSENRLLWRANRRRLDAETFRDAAIQVSGRLDLTMGGPGVEQFSSSKGIQNTPFLDYSGFDWNSDAARRRSVYRVVWRGIPDPFMEAIDFPDLGLLSAKREFSVSALQSLALLNNDFVLHASQWTAERIEREEKTKQNRASRAFELILLREPSASELKDLTTYTEAHGLAALCRVLFNSNEFWFVD